MDRSAIDAIVELALRADGTRSLDTLTPTVILHTNEGERIVSLEPYGAGRTRFRGTYATGSLPSFIAQVLANVDGRGKVDGFIEPEKMQAVVFFNLGTAVSPGHGDHRSTLTLKKTAAFASLLTAVSRPHTQRSLAEWIEDWREFLTPVTDGQPNGDTIAKVIAAVRDITVKTAREVTNVERDLGTTTSAMASIDAQSKHVLPEGFLFETEPYAGLPKRTFTLRLGSQSSDDKIVLTLRIQQAESIDEKIAQDFEKVLRDGLGDTANLSLGTFSV